MKKLRERKEEEAIKAGDYKFKPDEYWENISEAAKDFIKRCLAMDPTKRPSVWEILEHKWLSNDVPYFVTEVKMNDFDAKRTCKSFPLWFPRIVSHWLLFIQSARRSSL